MSNGFNLTFTDDGQWLHAEGSDFLFAYIDSSWPADLKASVAKAFKDALPMSTKIKAAVKNTSGQTVENGLYLLDEEAMTKAMNSIPGMGETAVNQKGESGKGTATSINAQFFAAVLAGVEGDLVPIMAYLNSEMENIQAQTKNESTFSNFGTVIGLISVMPELDVVTTTYSYAFSSSETAKWFVKVTCGSHEEHSYNYNYTEVTYNYAPD